MGKMIRKSNAGTRRLMCRLTEPEKDQKRRELVACCGVVLDVEKRLEDAKATVKAINEELKEEQGRHDIVARCLVSGEEERSIEFDHVLDYDSSRVLETVPAERLGRQGGGIEVVGMRDMHDSELNMQLSFVGEEVQDAGELKRAVVLYFNRKGKAERVEVGRPAEDDGDAALDESFHSGAGEDLGEDGFPDGPLPRIAQLRKSVLEDFDLDLTASYEEPETLLAALGHSVGLAAIFRNRPTEGRVEKLEELARWADNQRRLALEIGPEMELTAPLLDGEQLLPEPPDGLADDDDELSAQVARAGYWMTPEQLAELSMREWERLRHFAATAPALAETIEARGISDLPEHPGLPDGLDNRDISQADVLAKLLKRLGCRGITEDRIANLEDEDYADAVLWAVESWVARALNPAPHLLNPEPYQGIRPPACLIPEAHAEAEQRAEEKQESEMSDARARPYGGLVEMARPALETYLERLKVDELRTIAQGVCDVEAGFFDKKQSRTCIPAIIEAVEARRAPKDDAATSEFPAGTPGHGTHTGESG